MGPPLDQMKQIVELIRDTSIVKLISQLFPDVWIFKVCIF